MTIVCPATQAAFEEMICGNHRSFDAPIDDELLEATVQRVQLYCNRYHSPEENERWVDEAEELFERSRGMKRRTKHERQMAGLLYRRELQIMEHRAQGPQELVIWERDDGTPVFEDLPWRALIHPVAPLSAPNAMMRVFVAVQDGTHAILYNVIGWDQEKGMYVADRMDV